jgi:FkbM family methyltransferase
VSLAAQTKWWLRRHAPLVSHRLAVLRRSWMRARWRAQGMRSYSQFGEDVAAVRYFQKKRGGIYVDIGAYDGIHLSSTAMLELQYGWHGVLVEPIRTAYDRMVESRPGSTCIHGAVSAEKGPLRFTYSAADGGMLSGTAFDPRHQTRIEEESRRQHAQIEVLLVPAVHPNEVLRAAAALAPGGPDAKAIDFLSIDTEGTELDILKSIDWKTFRPKLLCVENDFQELHQADFLLSVGYRRTGKTLGYCNDFYEDAG